MIQRIQTVYLFLAFAATGILMLFVPLWTTSAGKPFFFMQDQLYTILLGLTTMLSIISIISFKKRQNQFVLNRLNIICLLYTSPSPRDATLSRMPSSA